VLIDVLSTTRDVGIPVKCPLHVDFVPVFVLVEVDDVNVEGLELVLPGIPVDTSVLVIDEVGEVVTPEEEETVISDEDVIVFTLVVSWLFTLVYVMNVVRLGIIEDDSENVSGDVAELAE
jgi:hypothetical protein